MSKKIEPLCKNCKLYENGHCKVIILWEGKQVHLPVEPNDKCFFENEFSAISPEGIKETFKPDVQQIKFWVENDKGEKVDGNGTVKIEYPEGFFGNEK